MCSIYELVSYISALYYSNGYAQETPADAIGDMFGDITGGDDTFLVIPTTSGSSTTYKILKLTYDEKYDFSIVDLAKLIYYMKNNSQGPWAV